MNTVSTFTNTQKHFYQQRSEEFVRLITIYLANSYLFADSQSSVLIVPS